MAKPRSLEQIKQNIIDEYKKRCKEKGVDLPDDVMRKEVERFLDGITQARQWLKDHPGLIRWPDFASQRTSTMERRQASKKFSVSMPLDENTDYAVPPGTKLEQP